MRTISGEITVPVNCPSATGAAILIEVRDVSLADAPSTVIAHMKLTNINLHPDDRFAFSLAVPEIENTRSLTLRVHISLSDSDRVRPGDLLTTASYPVPLRGTASGMVVPVTLI